MSADDVTRDARRDARTRTYAAERMAEQRAKGGYRVDVFVFAMAQCATMTTRHLSDGNVDFAMSYARTWRYLNDSFNRYVARRMATAGRVQ